jgi:two-component system, cell cycle sensor histidine kinase and response regulator CckA
MKILNADDVAENRYLLEFTLRSAGHEVVSVQDGAEALAAAEKDHFDVVISDVLMPRMDGFQLCRELKRRPGVRGVPFIFYTATYTDEKDAQLGLSLGAARFVVKPQDPQDFLRLVGEVVAEAVRGQDSPRSPPAPEQEFLAVYTQALVRKLDSKVIELGALSRRLQEELDARVREVAERRRAEEELRASEAALATAQRVARVGSFQLRVPHPDQLARAELRCSDELVRILGREGRAARPRLATDVLEGIAAADRPQLLAALRAVLASGGPECREFSLVLSDGSLCPVEVHLEAGANGAGVQVVTGTVQDLSERRRQEEIARHAQKMGNLGLLAAGIAHDFKNALSAILLNTEALLNGSTLTGGDREALEEMAEAGERAAQLTRQLLTFAQRRTLTLQRVDLRDVVTGLSAMLRRLLPQGVSLRCDLPPDPLPVMADVSLLEQVLVNLVVNARDAMPAGGQVVVEAGRAEVDAVQAGGVPDARPGPALRLRVSDSGVGIPPEHRARLFEPLFTTKPEGKGSGLGLATAYGIVRQHRGWLEVESAVGKGSRFEVYLPAADAAGPGAPRPG